MRKKFGEFYCFSPPAMLATFLIETGLAIYTLWRYKMTTTVRIAVSMLICLAVFQLAEFNICGRSNSQAANWSRIGYVAITLLPPLGTHLICTIARLKAKVLKWAAYGTGILFAATFGLSSQAFNGHVCAGNYAIFQLADNVAGAYFIYYYAWLFAAIGLALYLSLKATQKVREGLLLLVVGYLSFLLPTGLVNAVNPKTINGIPSVMCGFAVIFAIILAFGIVPITQPRRP
ncbi:MAG: histidine kinase N-terminal 7TM domain-containing protein [Candidatus Saccharimonadales bacterium]